MPTEILEKMRDTDFKVIQSEVAKEYEPEDFFLTRIDRSRSDDEINQKLTDNYKNDTEVYEKISLNSSTELESKNISRNSEDSSLEDDWGLDKLMMSSSILTESQSSSLMLLNQHEELMVCQKLF